MSMRHGAIHAPRPAGVARLRDRATVPSGLAVNWLERFPADGDALGNDRVGNCVPAADCQLIRLWGGAADGALALARYQMMTGCDPATGLPDVGTDTAVDMLSWCAAPILDRDGRPWPIYWASVDHTDETAIRLALTRFPLAITIGLPRAIADDPDRWSAAPGVGWTPDEPHRVVLGHADASGWRVRSWGEDYVVSPALMRLMLLAVDVPIPHPAAAPAHLELEGIDFAALEADLGALLA